MNQIGHTVNHNLKLVAFIVAPAFDLARLAAGWFRPLPEVIIR
jgi:hypothetical protein